MGSLRDFKKLTYVFVLTFRVCKFILSYILHCDSGCSVPLGIIRYIILLEYFKAGLILKLNVVHLTHALSIVLDFFFKIGMRHGYGYVFVLLNLTF